MSLEGDPPKTRLHFRPFCGQCVAGWCWQRFVSPHISLWTLEESHVIFLKNHICIYLQNIYVKMHLCLFKNPPKIFKNPSKNIKKPCSLSQNFHILSKPECTHHKKSAMPGPTLLHSVVSSGILELENILISLCCRVLETRKHANIFMLEYFGASAKIWKRNGTHLKESWHAYEWVMACIRMNLGPRIYESWHAREWVMLRIWLMLLLLLHKK